MNKGRWSYSNYRPLQRHCKRCKSNEVSETKYFSEGQLIQFIVRCNSCGYEENVMEEIKWN